jgi:hypothetical protein
MGRPKGSKNKAGHKAGGDQKPQDAKKKNQPKINWLPQKKKKKQALQEQGVGLDLAGQQEEEVMKQQDERLRHVFNHHPSNKYGVPSYVGSAESAHTIAAMSQNSMIKIPSILPATKGFSNLPLPQ